MIFKNDGSNSSPDVRKRKSSRADRSPYNHEETERSEADYSEITRVTKNTLLKKDKAYRSEGAAGGKFVPKRISGSQFCVYMLLMFLVFLVTFILIWILAALVTPACPTLDKSSQQNSADFIYKTKTWYMIYANEGNFLLPNTSETTCIQ